MDEYYSKIQDRLLIQKEMIDALLKEQNTRVRSDYYEAIVRDLVRENVPQAFSVSRGIILDKGGQNSEECDLILFESSFFDTWFQSGEIVVVAPEAVRAVIEIKRTLNGRNIEDAVSNLISVNELRKGIFKFIVGFNATRSYDALKEQCIQSKSVNCMFVFNTKKAEDKMTVKAEMKRFLQIMKKVTSTGVTLGLDAEDYFIEKVSGTAIGTRTAVGNEVDGFFITRFEEEAN